LICYDRLNRAGWSVGETALTHSWIVTGSNGENNIHVTGAKQTEAWREAIDQAAAVGMVADE
jgi:hypothetical protein